MKSLLIFFFALQSFVAWGNERACLEELDRLVGADDLLILQETRSSDGHPLILELTNLTLRHTTSAASVSSVGRKEGSGGGIVIRRTTGNFDITNCRTRNGRIEFRMGSVSISQLNRTTLRASVMTWNSEFRILN
jgi:hypothetical protein